MRKMHYHTYGFKSKPFSVSFCRSNLPFITSMFTNNLLFRKEKNRTEGSTCNNINIGETVSDLHHATISLTHPLTHSLTHSLSADLNTIII